MAESQKRTSTTTDPFCTPGNNAVSDSCQDVSIETPDRFHSTAACEDPRDECPKPLSAHQVLETFRAQSRDWRVDRGNYSLSGRVFGTGLPVYFLNGINGTHELMALLAWLLRDEFRCVLFDYPACDSTARGRNRLSTTMLTEDLFAIADELGDTRFSLLATSFGSLVALSAMLEQPSRIERAVIQGGFAHRHLSLTEKAIVRLACRVRGRLRHVPLRRQIQEQNHRRWFPPFDTDRWRFFLENSGNGQLAAIARRADLIRRTDLRPRLSEITTRVLLVGAEGDGVVAQQCHDELENGLPNSQSVWLENSGHLPCLTHPHRVRKLVRPFLLKDDS